MAGLNWVDYIILAVFFFSILAGLTRGLVREILVVLTWIAAYIIASLFATPLANIFTGAIPGQSGGGATASTSLTFLSLGISFVCIFLVVMVFGSVMSYLISRTLDRAGIGVANRLLGGLFGIVRGFLINLLVIFIVQLSSLDQEPWWKESTLVPRFQPALVFLGTWINPSFDTLKSKVTQTMQQGQHMFNQFTMSF